MAVCWKPDSEPERLKMSGCCSLPRRNPTRFNKGVTDSAWSTLRSTTFGERIKLSGCDRRRTGLDRVSSLCLIAPFSWIQ